MTCGDTIGSVAALTGWAADDHAAALRAYAATVDLLGPEWPRPTGPARDFFAKCFRVGPASEDALLTGYYEPELRGTTRPDETNRFALYGTPPDIDPTLPWHDRAEIEAGDLLAGRELVWLDSPLEAFLAQVQGSVRVRLPDGGILRLGFAAKNGQPYSSIGKELIRRGALAEDDASVDSIRDWAARHSAEVPGLLRINRSFVFFRLLDLDPAQGPLGTMQRPVTPGRTLAVDPRHIPLGAPVWVEWQGAARLMVAQDTGSAITGPARGDIFFGSGPEAGRLAGNLKSSGRMTPLLPADLR